MNGAARPGRRRLGLHPRDGERHRAEAREGVVRLLPVPRPEGPAVGLEDLEAAGVAAARARQVGEDLPVFLGLEGADLPLALDHEPHRHRLHPARRQAAGDLRPEQRGDLEADHAVEEAPRLLGVHPVLVDRLGVRERLADGVAGNLVEHHPPEAGGVASHLLLEMPGNRLPLAVEVGGEIDGAGLAGQPLELADDLLLARQDLVGGAPAVVRIDAHPSHELAPRLPLALGRTRPRPRLPPARRGTPLAGAPLAADREIPDVPHARLDEVLGAQIAVDGAGLGRRLDDDQGSCHGSTVTRLQRRLSRAAQPPAPPAPPFPAAAPPASCPSSVARDAARRATGPSGPSGATAPKLPSRPARTGRRRRGRSAPGAPGR